MTDAGALHLDFRGSTALVTIDNPGKRNAMTPAMWRAWPAVMEAAASDADVRAVVVTGAGGSFCAGADIAQLDSIHDSELPVAAHEAIAGCPKPVIAAIEGACVGGGVQVAIACDLRVASEGARLGVTPANLGILYPLVSLRRLVQVVGPANTKYLIFTGELVDAHRARHMGLVDEVRGAGTVLDRALELAAHLATRSQLTIQATKDVVDRLADGALPPERVQAWAREVAASPDVAEGVAAFAERRRPSFTWNGNGLPG